MIPLAVACGVGNNSVPMLLGMYERSIRPDVILVADTGNEKPGTYRYLWSVLTPWCISHDFPAPVVVIKGGRRETLEENCLREQMLPSIAYGFKGCSHKYKIEPQDQWCNHWMPARAAWMAGGKVRKAIGYHAGEPQRASIESDAKYEYVYPLIEWGWAQAECLEAFKRHNLPAPGKSACFFCPATKKYELLRLHRDHPELTARAMAMEDNAGPNLTQIKGLGRSWSWRDVIGADEDQLKLLPEAPAISCICMDGDDE